MAIELAAGVGISLISGEHLFSTLLSSPWTTKKFAITEAEKHEVRRLYITAIALTLLTAMVMAWLLKEIWCLIAALLLCLIYVSIYERALSGKV